MPPGVSHIVRRTPPMTRHFLAQFLNNSENGSVRNIPIRNSTLIDTLTGLSVPCTLSWSTDRTFLGCLCKTRTRSDFPGCRWLHPPAHFRTPELNTLPPLGGSLHSPSDAISVTFNSLTAFSSQSVRHAGTLLDSPAGLLFAFKNRPRYDHSSALKA